MDDLYEIDEMSVDSVFNFLASGSRRNASGDVANSPREVKRETVYNRLGIRADIVTLENGEYIVQESRIGTGTVSNHYFESYEKAKKYCRSRGLQK